MSQKQRKAKYYFRGTTLGYPGNSVNRQMPVTSVTINQAKAILFAWFCRKSGSPVIYVTLADAVFAKREEELGFVIKPLEFAKLSEGYLKLADALSILHQLKISIPPLFIDLDDCLKEMINLTDEQIENFYKLAKPLLKNT